MMHSSSTFPSKNSLTGPGDIKSGKTRQTAVITSSQTNQAQIIRLQTDLTCLISASSSQQSLLLLPEGNPGSDNRFATVFVCMCVFVWGGRTTLRVVLLILCSNTQLIQQQSAQLKAPELESCLRRLALLGWGGESVSIRGDQSSSCGVGEGPEEGGDTPPPEGSDQKVIREQRVAQTDSVQRGRWTNSCKAVKRSKR